MKWNMLQKILLLAITTLMFVACNKSDDVNEGPILPEEPIVILYENDVHCAVNGYAKFVAQRKIQEAVTPFVSTVSGGDFVSGGTIGAVTQGEAIITIMNEVGYDAVVLGNHELDYGIEQMLTLTDRLKAPVLCANLMNAQTQECIYPAYHIISYGDVDIAYIGFTTTTSGTVKQLCDEQGNEQYSFMRDEFYDIAQNAIDNARKDGADYIVALSHLGDMDRGVHPNSLSLIAQTSGLDAVIDGHDHHVIEEQLVANKDGKLVLLTSTGTGFKNVGVLTLSTQGLFRSSLINIEGDDSPKDEQISQFVERIEEEALQSGNYVIGQSDVDLSIYDSDGTRIVRKQETNIGNLISDAFRVYTSADIAMVNGGGIRTNITKGQITFNDIHNVMPFGDMVYTATITGQQLLDAMEFSVSNLPKESGEFMQVSGMRFEVDASIPSPVVCDEESDLYLHVGEGTRRVSNLQVLDHTSGEYRPVNLSQEYTLASIDYILLEMGGSGILRYTKPIDNYWGMCIECITSYISNTLNGHIDSQYGNTEGRIVFR